MLSISFDNSFYYLNEKNFIKPDYYDILFSYNVETCTFIVPHGFNKPLVNLPKETKNINFL